jgi:hypothetical protein
LPELLGELKVLRRDDRLVDRVIDEGSGLEFQFLRDELGEVTKVVARRRT